MLFLALNACAVLEGSSSRDTERLRETASLIAEIKGFGKSLGIEPTLALSRTSADEKTLSMLWIWLQKAGTMALRASVDIRMAIGIGAAKERAPLEQIYRVEGYSVYYRQGNEFADSRSAATLGFAAQGVVRRVNIVFHEDLHGDANFDLPWDIEEAVVTPLGMLATVEYFKDKADAENLKRAEAALIEGRRISQELHGLIQEAERIFRHSPIDVAKREVLSLLSNYPTYHAMFRRQIVGQHPGTALEAKLSHDLAYFRYFDKIVTLAERAPSLKALIEDLKSLPREATFVVTEQFLRGLHTKYDTPAN